MLVPDAVLDIADVFEDWLLRKVCGPHGEEVSGDWRKYYKEKLLGYNRMCVIS
jgi:hypothetical protein